MAPSEQLEYWPYAEQQQDKLQLLITRLNIWKDSVKLIITFLDSVIAIEKKVAIEHLNLSNALEIQETALGSGILKAWVKMAQSIPADVSGGEHQITNLVLHRLKQLKQDLKKKVSIFKSSLNDAIQDVNSTRKRTLLCIQSHEKYLIARHNSGETPEGENPIVDPWLSERVLYKQFKTMISGENEFQQDISSSVKELCIFDAHVVEELKRILEEYVLARSNQWQSMQTHLKLAGIMGTSTISEASFDHFSTINNFQAPELWSTERNIEDFPYKTNEIKIIKKGLIYIPGGFAGDRWTPCLGVLTDTGFLHCFKVSNSEHERLVATYNNDTDESQRRSSIFSVATLKRALTIKKQSKNQENLVYDDLDKPKAELR
jgi:hypothetical protein